VSKHRRLLEENIYHVYNRNYTVFTNNGYTVSVLFCRKLNTESCVPFTILPSIQRKFNRHDFRHSIKLKNVKVFLSLISPGNVSCRHRG